MAKYEIIKVQLDKVSQSEEGSSFYKMSQIYFTVFLLKYNKLFSKKINKKKLARKSY